jgi:hypothetical protein
MIAESRRHVHLRKLAPAAPLLSEAEAEAEVFVCPGG